MSPKQPAPRAEFTVRCACGTVYHTSDAHLGRKLPCRCGRTIIVERPLPATPEPPPVVEPVHTRTRKVRRVRRTSPSSSGTEHASRWERAAHTVSVWLAGMIRPLVHGSTLVRITAWLAWGYLLGMTAAWIALVYTSEHSLPGTIIAYGPRWLALWPLVLLVPLSAVVVRSTLWPLLLALWIGLVPVMGARVSFATLFAQKLPAVPAPGTFRMLTFNVERGQRLAYDLAVMLKEQRPDIVTFQECGPELWDSLQAQPGWHSSRHGSLCTGSRWPISQVEIMPREDLARISTLGFGGTGLVMRAFLDTPHGPLVLVNLHLETARKGLEGMLGREGFVPDNLHGGGQAPALPSAPDAGSNVERFRYNATIRNAESERASRWASRGIDNTPLIVAGDFNLPVESTIFSEQWGGFTDAFEARGNGLGWSKREGRWLRIRIDHVLTNDAGPRPVRIVLGPDYSSDHLPVIVDLAWPTRAAAQR